MFALPFNFPFRKNDGSLSTIGAEISGGGGGGYVLPPATADTLGGVKVGSNLTVGDDGTLSAPTPTPPYILPSASTDVLGGVKIGDGLSIDNNGVIKDVSTVRTSLNGLINVESDSTLKLSHDGDIYTISGFVELTNELVVGDRVQIGLNIIPTEDRISADIGWFPMVVTMCDTNVTKFTIATLTVYPNGNIFINNNFADIKAKYLYVCCQYPKNI